MSSSDINERAREARMAELEPTTFREGKLNRHIWREGFRSGWNDAATKEREEAVREFIEKVGDGEGEVTFGQLCYEVRRELHLALTMMAMAGARLVVREIGGWQMVTAAIGLTLIHAYCMCDRDS